MSHWFIETKKQTVAFMPFENHGVIRVSLHEKQIHGHYSSDDKTLEVVLIPLTDKHIKKLQSYKSVSALVKYAKANQIEQATPDNDVESIPDNGACSSPRPAPVPVPAESVQGQGILIAECDQTINSESVSNTSLGDDPIHHHRDTLFVDTETTGLSYKDEDKSDQITQATPDNDINNIPDNGVCVSPCSVSAPAPAKLSGKWEQGILFCDTETTGIGKDDEIVEIAFVDINENVVFESLVKPSKPIPKKASNVHGITNAMVKNAPSFAEIFNALQLRIKYKDFSGNNEYHTIIFYNKNFDTRLICQSARKSFDYPKRLNFSQLLGIDRPNAMNIRCLMTEYARYWGEWNDYRQNYKWQSLFKACRQQNIPIDDIPNHRASGDAIKTARLYKTINSPPVSKLANKGHIPLMSLR